MRLLTVLLTWLAFGARADDAEMDAMTRVELTAEDEALLLGALDDDGMNHVFRMRKQGVDTSTLFHLSRLHGSGAFDSFTSDAAAEDQDAATEADSSPPGHHLRSGARRLLNERDRGIMGSKTTQCDSDKCCAKKIKGAKAPNTECLKHGCVWCNDETMPTGAVPCTKEPQTTEMCKESDTGGLDSALPPKERLERVEEQLKTLAHGTKGVKEILDKLNKAATKTHVSDPTRDVLAGD